MGRQQEACFVFTSSNHPLQPLSLVDVMSNDESLDPCLLLAVFLIDVD